MITNATVDSSALCSARTGVKMNASKKILLFHIEAKKARQIKDLCQTLGIGTVCVSPKEYGAPLGKIAGVTDLPSSSSPDQDSFIQRRELPSEMMVFSGFPSEDLEHFLKCCRDAGIPPTPLKAVLTPHNIFWSAEKLYGELLQEHAFFHP